MLLICKQTDEYPVVMNMMWHFSVCNRDYHTPFTILYPRCSCLVSKWSTFMVSFFQSWQMRTFQRVLFARRLVLQNYEWMVSCVFVLLCTSLVVYDRPYLYIVYYMHILNFLLVYNYLLGFYTGLYIIYVALT